MDNNFKSEFAQTKTKVIFIFAMIIMLLGTTLHVRKADRSGNNDFRVYYKTAERIKVNNWDDIYTRKDGPFPYRYVPYTLMGVSMLNIVSEGSSREVWMSVQALGFAIGLYYLYRSLIILRAREPLYVISATMILTFRQYLDSLYSGQIAGIIYLSFSLGLYFYLKRQTILDGMANSVATSLKILPGFLLIHGFIKAPDNKTRFNFVLSGIVLFIVLNLLLLGWLKIYNADHMFKQLWMGWIEIVGADGEYFDGSTPKNQALRGAILRIFGRNEQGETIWKVAVLIGSIGLIWHWIAGKSKDLFHEAYSYAIGVMAFILFMPESLPYQLVNVSIPLAVLMAGPYMKTEKIYKVMVALFMLVISFAASDIIGRKPSDWFQQQSFAVVVMCLMAFLLLKGGRKMNQVVKT